jgi:hypothetical protein
MEGDKPAGGREDDGDDCERSSDESEARHVRGAAKSAHQCRIHPNYRQARAHP